MLILETCLALQQKRIVSISGTEERIRLVASRASHALMHLAERLVVCPFLPEALCLNSGLDSGSLLCFSSFLANRDTAHDGCGACEDQENHDSASWEAQRNVADNTFEIPTKSLGRPEDSVAL